MIPDAYQDVKDTDGSLDVDTTLIPVDQIVSINNLLHLSLSWEHLGSHLVSDPLIQSWVVIDAGGGGGWRYNHSSTGLTPSTTLIKTPLKVRRSLEEVSFSPIPDGNDTQQGMDLLWPRRGEERLLWQACQTKCFQPLSHKCQHRGQMVTEGGSEVKWFGFVWLIFSCVELVSV